MELLLAEPARPLVPSMPVNKSVTAAPTEICRAAGSFLSWRTYENPSVHNPLFQQDNARIHTAKQFAVNLGPVPYSPNLNPIEHAWVLLRQVHIDYPWIIDYRGVSLQVKKKLTEILPLRWENIPPKQFEAMWRSMPVRVQAVIEAKGRYTRH